MRIALLSSDWRPTGGITTYVRSLAGALTAAGHAVLVLHGEEAATSAGGDEPFRVSAVPGVLGAHAAQRPALTQAALDALAAFGPDVVHVQSNNNFPLERALQSRWPALKTFHTHEYCPTGGKYHFATERPCDVRTGLMCVPRMGYLRCTLSRRPNVIWNMYRHTTEANAHHRQFRQLIVCSQHLKQQAVLTGFDAARIEVLPYFTTARGGDTPITSRDVLFVGRLVRAKGVDLLLDALRRVPGPWRALVAGDGLEKRRLQRLASKWGLADRVEFPGWLSGDALSRAYARAAVVVMPSRWPEPFGIVGLEALAHGRPVVAFDVGGISEWLDESAGGSLVRPLDRDAMAGRIAWMLDHPEEAGRTAALGRARVARDFSAEAHLGRLLPIYERVRAVA